MLGIFATARNVMAVVGTVAVLDNLVPPETQEKVAGKCKDRLAIGLERLLYGPPTRKEKPYAGWKVAYDNLQQRAEKIKDVEPPKPRYSSYTRYNQDRHRKWRTDDIRFNSYDDAIKVKRTLMDSFENDGLLTVADMLDICGVDCEYEKDEYTHGWRDNYLHDFDIYIEFNDMPAGKYYYFVMPDVVNLIKD